MAGGGYRGTQGRKRKASTIVEDLRKQEEAGATIHRHAWRKDGTCRCGEVKPEGAGEGVPKPPQYLKGEARKEWVRLAPELYEDGRLDPLDYGTFARYCIAHQECLFAQAMLEGPIGYCPNCDPRKRKRPEGWSDCSRPRPGSPGRAAHKETEFGREIMGRLGKREISPYVRLREKAEAQMNRLMGEFGLTSASRSRLPARRRESEPAKRQAGPSMEPPEDPRKAFEAKIIAGQN